MTEVKVIWLCLSGGELFTGRSSTIISLPIPRKLPFRAKAHRVVNARVGVEDKSDDEAVKTQNFGENEDKDLVSANRHVGAGKGSL